MTGAAAPVLAARPATDDERVPVRELVRRLIADDAAVGVGLAVTLLLVLLYSPPSWYVRTPVVMIALVGWLWRGALRAPRLWLLLAAVLAGGVYTERLTIDNHQYLMVYWCLAIALSVGAADPARSLRRNARLLVGLTFAFALAWKVSSPELVSGAFFEYELLVDPRFAGVTELIAGVPRAALEANQAAMKGLTGIAPTATAAALTSAPAVEILAQVLTWFTLVVEAWIALAFLLPRPRWLSRSRDLPLLLFLFSTYSVATVAGFAYLLIAMGSVQCERRRWWIPCGYLAAVFVIQIFLLPLGHIGAVLGL